MVKKTLVFSLKKVFFMVFLGFNSVFIGFNVFYIVTTLNDIYGWVMLTLLSVRVEKKKTIFFSELKTNGFTNKINGFYIVSMFFKKYPGLPAWVF